MRRAAVALAALMVSGLLPTSIGKAQATELAPSATVSPQTVAVDGVIQVTGVGWQPGSLVDVEVCGNRAARGSLDCVAAGRQTDIDRQGTFRTSLTVAAPPSPCPCVVAVSAVPGPDRALVPLQIVGAPETPLPEQPAPAPHLVVHANLEGSGPWTAWFGASSERTLVLTVRNTGTGPAEMRLAVATGRGDTADVGVNDPGRLEPGASRTLRVPVHFDPLAFGRQTVAGEIAAPGTVARFDVRTSVYPWGLLVLALVLVLLLLLLVLRKVRRRRAARAETAKASSELADSADAIEDWDEDGEDDDWDEGWEEEDGDEGREEQGVEPGDRETVNEVDAPGEYVLGEVDSEGAADGSAAPAPSAPSAGNGQPATPPRATVPDSSSHDDSSKGHDGRAIRWRDEDGG